MKLSERICSECGKGYKDEVIVLHVPTKESDKKILICTKCALQRKGQ